MADIRDKLLNKSKTIIVRKTTPPFKTTTPHKSAT